MDKQQKLKIALPVLLAVMVFIWGPIITGSGSKKDRANSNVSQTNAGTDGGISVPIKTRYTAKSSYEEWGTNPFMPGYDKKSMMIEGILWDEQSPQVMINGKIIGTGSMIENMTVIEIKPNSIIIEDDKGQKELGIGEAL